MHSTTSPKGVNDTYINKTTFGLDYSIKYSHNSIHCPEYKT